MLALQTVDSHPHDHRIGADSLRVDANGGGDGGSRRLRCERRTATDAPHSKAEGMRDRTLTIARRFWLQRQRDSEAREGPEERANPSHDWAWRGGKC
eukprot:1958638-Rhodomonas_salina.1